MAALLCAALPELERLARYLSGNDMAEASDLVQETCKRALEARAQFAEGTNALAWLRAIMRNLHCDEARRSWRLVSAPLERLPAPSPGDEPLWVRASDNDLHDALAALPASHRITYERFVLGGERQWEIARQLGIAPGTVASRIRRARTSMRAFLLTRQQGGNLFSPSPVRGT